MNLKKTPLLANTVLCLLESLLAAAIGTVFLVCLVLLLSGIASANTREGMTAMDTLSIRDMGNVTRGSLLFHNNEDYQLAPILHTDVDISITGMIARVKLAQRFHNPDTVWQEGIYVFPLPENAAVDHLRMRIGKRVIEGQIRERETAKKEYQKARDNGQKASLVEQERPNIFTTSVANIGPGEEIIIEIEYQQTVRYDSGEFRLRFPMVVAPRYIPGSTVVQGFSGSGWAVNTDQVWDAERITPPVTKPGEAAVNPVMIDIHLDAGIPLEHITSSHHNIQIDQQDVSTYSIQLEHVTMADRDFELYWQPEKKDAPQAAFFRERKHDMDYGLIMMLPPLQQSSQVLNREVVFVIDTSGSMGGQSIIQARSALMMALERLKPGDSFNIIEFNSHTDQLFEWPRLVNHQSLRQAKQYVAGLDASGGTEMLPALKLALNDNNNTSSVRQVIFLTDGSIGNEAALFNTITRELGRSRLFTIGIGSAPNSHFMTRAARFGRGTYTYIGKVSEVETKMSTLFGKLESPVLTNIHIDWGDATDLEAWPKKIPDLYLGEPLLVSVSASLLPEMIRLTGSVSGSLWKTSMQLKGHGEHEGIHALWARKKIAALMDLLNQAKEENNLKQQVIETALRHHLVSRFTSLIAVDITPSRIKEELLRASALPVNLPSGWQYEKVFGQLPQTATDAELKILIGMLLLLVSVFLVMNRRYVYPD